MATAYQVEQFRQGFDRIENELARDMRRVLPRARRLHPAGARDLFLDIGPQLSDRYGQTAATIAAEFFEATTGRAARVAELTSPDAVEGSVRAIAGKLWTPEREAAFSQMSGAIARHALQAGRSTIAQSSSRNRISYARAPEADACEWCMMLASRGAVYGSARSAGEGDEWHDRCRCVAEPVTQGGQLSYDVDAAYERYMRIRHNS